MNRNGIIGIVVLVILILLGVWALAAHNNAIAPSMEVQSIETQDQATTSDAMASSTGTSSGAMVDVSVGVTTGSVKSFTVTGKDFSFTPATLTVKKGDTVKLTFKNADGFHDFRIDELGVQTNVIKTGESQTVQFVASKTGTFDYYCSVGNHRAMGMEGKITVTE